MKLSIIVVNYNTKTFLDKCLNSIYRNPLLSGNFEIIVVDNASEDGSIDLIQKKYPEVKIIKNEKNLGFAKANNIGIKISRGKYVLLLNSDTKVLNESLNRMFDYMEMHPSVGIVGPKLLGEGGEIIQMSWHWNPTILKEALQKILAPQYISKYAIIQLVVKFLVRKERDVELVPGACMFIRKEVLDTVGLLDENLFLYFEEPDFCMRVRKAGWEIVFLPEAEVIHKLGQTMKKIGKETLIIYRKSQIYFYKKNNSRLQQRLLKLFLLVKFSYLKMIDFKNSGFYNKILNIVNESEMNELSKLQNAALTGISLGNGDLEHLSNKVGISNYIRIADEIKNNMKSGKILDWGCGYGHMTYLLRNRGLSVTAYEVLKRDNIEKLPVFSEIDIIYGKENFRLPFSDEMFDAVLSCGTLEHVEDIDISLAEVRRILKKEGKFFIYMFPNKFSYAEWLAEKRGISVHPVKFNKKSIYRLLEHSGLKIIKIKKSSVLPKNLTGFPGFIKKFYGNLYFLLIPFDNLLSKIPVLNCISGVFEIIAVKI